mmetsp:Transcript_13311/g.28983  ORF Transcript_13311/g.28983 Transcript_13311/m.28983 type:complete len:88 (-) Transcript_13311:744-1007(-)
MHKKRDLSTLAFRSDLDETPLCTRMGCRRLIRYRLPPRNGKKIIHLRYNWSRVASKPAINGSPRRGRRWVLLIGSANKCRVYDHIMV